LRGGITSRIGTSGVSSTSLVVVCSSSNSRLDEAEQMEAVFILSEIPEREATEALATVAATRLGRHEEVRAAAVWGLGTGACAQPERALDFAVDADDRVALHAAAAIQTLSPAAVEKLRDWLRGDPRHASVAAALLAQRDVGTLVEGAAEDGKARLWAIRALGDLPPAEVRGKAGSALTAAMLDELEPHVDPTRGLAEDDRERGCLAAPG
jgi:hypothetical protein